MRPVGVTVGDGFRFAVGFVLGLACVVVLPLAVGVAFGLLRGVAG